VPCHFDGHAWVHIDLAAKGIAGGAVVVTQGFLDRPAVAEFEVFVGDIWRPVPLPISLAQVAQIMANSIPKRGCNRQISRFLRSEIGVMSM